MGKIEILHDSGDVYKVGSIINVMDFIQDYIDCCSDKSLANWIVRIPIPSAIKYIADAWGIEYKFV